jgi:hypothetical protein
MKILATAVFAICCALTFNAWAANSQQDRMAACNKDAGDKTGDEHKQFMKECLSTKKNAGGAKMSQQDKMRACNKQATGKKGDERKQFMSECLKG